MCQIFLCGVGVLFWPLLEFEVWAVGVRVNFRPCGSNPADPYENGLGTDPGRLDCGVVTGFAAGIVACFVSLFVLAPSPAAATTRSTAAAGQAEREGEGRCGAPVRINHKIQHIPLLTTDAFRLEPIGNLQWSSCIS